MEENTLQSGTLIEGTVERITYSRQKKKRRSIV